MARTLPAQARVLNGLKELGGEINDPAGRATVVLANHVGQARNRSDLRLLAATLQRAEQAGLVERVVRGRRTYRIALTNGAGAGGRRTAAPAQDREAVLPDTEEGQAEAIAAAVLRQVADSLNRAAALDGLRRDMSALEEANRGLSAQLDEANGTIRKLRNQIRRLERAAPSAEVKPKASAPAAKAKPTRKGRSTKR